MITAYRNTNELAYPIIHALIAEFNGFYALNRSHLKLVGTSHPISKSIQVSKTHSHLRTSTSIHSPLMLTKCRPTQCRRASSLMPNLCRILAIPHPSPSPPSLHHSSASPTQTRASSSNSRWKSRQGGDPFVREARVRGLKSRAAFKLLEIDSQHKIFHRSATVVDLGYAPGSWSQVAKDRVGPYGIVVGIDLLPHQPPPGVSTIQGDFLNPAVQEMAKGFILEATRKKALERAERVEAAKLKQEEDREGETGEVEDGGDRKVGEEGRGSGGSDVVMEQKSYIEAERLAAREAAESESEMDENTAKEEKIVSVCLPHASPIPILLLTFDQGGVIRHVSTLAPNPWLLRQQLE